MCPTQSGLAPIVQVAWEKAVIFVIPGRPQCSFLSGPRSKMRWLFISLHLPSSLLRSLHRGVSPALPFLSGMCPSLQIKSTAALPNPSPDSKTHKGDTGAELTLHTASLGHHTGPQDPLSNWKAQATRSENGRGPARESKTGACPSCLSHRKGRGPGNSGPLQVRMPSWHFCFCPA